MTLPLTSPFTTGAQVTKAQLDQLVAAINSAGFGYAGDRFDTGTVTMPATGTNYAGSASVTITVPPSTQRRYKVTCQAKFTANTVPVRFVMWCGYNTGASANVNAASAVTSSSAASVSPPGTGSGDATTGTVVAAFLLTAGTYTFYPVLSRNAGSNTDSATNFYVLVEDIGAV